MPDTNTGRLLQMMNKISNRFEQIFRTHSSTFMNLANYISTSVLICLTSFACSQSKKAITAVNNDLLHGQIDTGFHMVKRLQAKNCMYLLDSVISEIRTHRDYDSRLKPIILVSERCLIESQIQIRATNDYYILDPVETDSTIKSRFRGGLHYKGYQIMVWKANFSQERCKSAVEHLFSEAADSILIEYYVFYDRDSHQKRFYPIWDYSHIYEFQNGRFYFRERRDETFPD